MPAQRALSSYINFQIFVPEIFCFLSYSFLFAVRQLADIAMTEAANYKSEYGSPIPVKYLTDRVSNYVHAYTLYSALRPFGTTIMMGSYTDIDGPELYCIENSGLYYRYWGCAVSNSDF